MFFIAVFLRDLIPRFPPKDLRNQGVALGSKKPRHRGGRVGTQRVGGISGWLDLTHTIHFVGKVTRYTDHENHTL